MIKNILKINLFNLVIKISGAKTLRILGGIIVLLGTFVFSWLSFSGGVVSGFGIVNIQNFLDAAKTSTEPMLIYLTMILFICTTISSLMILIGIKSRFLVILFGLIALIMGIFLILGVLSDIEFIDNIDLVILFLTIDDPIIEGVLPYSLIIFDDVSLGMLLLTIGGFLSFLGGCLKIKD